MEKPKIIRLNNGMFPEQLTIARGYRGLSQTALCKAVKGVSQPNLSKFEKGYFCALSEDALKRIMLHLNFPYSWLFIEAKKVKYCS